MAQVRKNSASQPSEMTVLDKGNKIARPSSVGSPKQNTIMIAPEGLIVLPPEPGAVKFENVAMCTPPDVHLESSCGGRVGSAGRVERSLQMTRKKETDFDLPRSTIADGQIENSIQSTKGVQVKSLEALKPTLGPHASSSHTEKKEDSESSAGDSSDSDGANDDNDDEDHATLTNGAGAQGNKVEASVELKGEFLKAVMDEDYEKAKELCQKILLLEPDNKTCSEFHAVIVEKMKQEEEGSDDDGTDESDNSSEHDDDEESDDESSDDDGDNDDGDDDEDETDSDDDFMLPPGPINLIMGGLPIRPQSR